MDNAVNFTNANTKGKCKPHSSTKCRGPGEISPIHKLDGEYFFKLVLTNHLQHACAFPRVRKLSALTPVHTDTENFSFVIKIIPQQVQVPSLSQVAQTRQNGPTHWRFLLAKSVTNEV